MELTNSERMLLELLQEKDDAANRESHQRRMRFMTGVAERVGIAVDALRINPATGEITDASDTSASGVSGDPLADLATG